MILKAKILDDIKVAMKAQEKEKLAVLRMVSAAIKQVEVDERVEMDDARVTSVLTRMVKQRRESIEQFSKANRTDLVAQEEAELVIILPYLPAQLSDEEIQSVLTEAIGTTGAASMKDMGKVMGLVKEKLEGRADMGKVSQMIKGLLG